MKAAEKRGANATVYIKAHIAEPKRHTRRKNGEAVSICTRCGDTGGKPYQGRKAPGRGSGAKFGIVGQLCRKCYHALYMREWGWSVCGH